MKLPPSFGGMSLTDLPIRWILAISKLWNGCGGKGVLGMYLSIGDARQWHMMSKEDKIKRALHDLQLLYPELNHKGAGLAVYTNYIQTIQILCI